MATVDLEVLTPSAPGDRGRLRPLGSLMVLGAICCVAVLTAYWYSIRSLAVSFSLASPSSFEVIVPLLAVALGAWLLATTDDGPAIHDRQVDYVIGGAIVAVALFMLATLPSRMGVAYWVQRIDLLSLPVFAAGAVVLVLGTRRLWRVRAAVLLLLLAWPPIVRVVIDASASRVGSASARLVREVALALGLATAAARPSSVRVGTSVFALGGAANFLAVVLLVTIVALALALACVGTPIRKASWVVTSMALAVLANVVRLLLAIVAAHVLTLPDPSPLLGPLGIVVATTIALAGSIALMSPFGLTWSTLRKSHAAGAPANWLGVLVVAVAAVVAAALAGSVTGFAQVTTPIGEPRAMALLDQPQPVVGYAWSKLGAAVASPSLATSRRYTFQRVGSAPGVGVIVDVLAVADAGGGAVADLRAHFPLVNRRVLAVDSLGVGHDVRAERLTFGGVGQTWTALTWLLPVRGRTGAHYERLVVATDEPRSVTQQAASPGGAPPPDTSNAVPSLETYGRAIVTSEFVGASR